ncbi:MAG: 4Fe-4S dicluster domain-containing protein [bacterium]|nr:4Fe-4S dicluster domain-containing protein [bacterium]
MNRRDFLKIAGVGMVSTIFEPVLPYEIKPSKKRLALLIDITKPFDIKACLDACNKAHNIPEIEDPKHKIKWIWPERFSDVFSEQIDMPKEITIPVLCNHCENPPCVRVCPTKATFKRKDGIVMMDYHRCIGCRFCMAACPYGARSFNWIDPKPFIKGSNPKFPTRTKGVVEKCNFCAERLDKRESPACVEPSNGSLIFGYLSEMKDLISNRYCLRRKPDLGTSPSVYYLI